MHQCNTWKKLLPNTIAAYAIVHALNKWLWCNPVSFSHSTKHASATHVGIVCWSWCYWCQSITAATVATICNHRCILPSDAKTDSNYGCIMQNKSYTPMRRKTGWQGWPWWWPQLQWWRQPQLPWWQQSAVVVHIISSNIDRSVSNQNMEYNKFLWGL